MGRVHRLVPPQLGVAVEPLRDVRHLAERAVVGPRRVHRSPAALGLRARRPESVVLLVGTLRPRAVVVLAADRGFGEREGGAVVGAGDDVLRPGPAHSGTALRLDGRPVPAGELRAAALRWQRGHDRPQAELGSVPGVEHRADPAHEGRTRRGRAAAGRVHGPRRRRPCVRRPTAGEQQRDDRQHQPPHVCPPSPGSRLVGRATQRRGSARYGRSVTSSVGVRRRPV